jgi:hypothetical protein
MQMPYSVLHAVREWFFKQACSDSRHNLQSLDFWACTEMFRLYAANSSNRTVIARMSTSSQCTLTCVCFQLHGPETNSSFSSRAANRDSLSHRRHQLVAAGSRTRNELPFLLSLASSICPPLASIAQRAIARPSPTPPSSLERLASTR